MEQKSNKALAKDGAMQKLKRKIKKLFGYKEPQEYIYDVIPLRKTSNDMELTMLANIERKLTRIMEQNSAKEELTFGLDYREAERLLEWTVQNAREHLLGEKEITASLQGHCGMGQAITSITLRKMGLEPNILNTNPTISNVATNHAFVTVEIPVKDNEKIENRLYLIDTTYRQFFIREGLVPSNKQYVKDKRYGGKVAPLAGYWTLQLPGGKEFAQELLSKGYIYMSERNAKLYGDGFFLEGIERKDFTKVPRKKDLITDVDGATYIKSMKNKHIQSGIDKEEKEIEENKINVNTPLMQIEQAVEESLATLEEKNGTVKKQEISIEKE